MRCCRLPLQAHLLVLFSVVSRTLVPPAVPLGCQGCGLGFLLNRLPQHVGMRLRARQMQWHVSTPGPTSKSTPLT